MLSTHPLFLYQFLSSSHPLLSSQFFTLPTHPVNLPALHTKQHNSQSRLIVRMHSAPINLSNSTGVFGHRAILTMGGSRHGWGFSHRTNRYIIKLLSHRLTSAHCQSNVLWLIRMEALIVPAHIVPIEPYQHLLKQSSGQTAARVLTNTPPKFLEYPRRGEGQC